MAKKKKIRTTVYLTEEFLTRLDVFLAKARMNRSEFIEEKISGVIR